MVARLGDVPMKHPFRSDFHTVVTEESVSVTFKPTSSTYKFYRLTNANNIAQFGPVAFSGVQHAGHNTEDYPPDEVQDMAQRIAAEFAASVGPVRDGNAFAGARNATADATARPISPARTQHTGPSGNTKAQRVASEVAATLWLIQNLDKAD
jgi:hypothetical protein